MVKVVKSKKITKKSLIKSKLSSTKYSSFKINSKPKSKKLNKNLVKYGVGATSLASLLYTGYKFNKAYENQKPIGFIKKTENDKRSNTRIGYLTNLITNIGKKIPLAPGNNEYTKQQELKNTKTLLLDNKSNVVRDKNGTPIYATNKPIINSKTGQQINFIGLKSGDNKATKIALKNIMIGKNSIGKCETDDCRKKIIKKNKSFFDFFKM